MKVTTELIDIPAFEPVSFTIECESEDDLYLLWHLFNRSKATFLAEHDKSKNTVPLPKSLRFHRLWAPINKTIRERKLHNKS